MHYYEYNPEVKLMLLNHASSKKNTIVYNANQLLFHIPKIVPRPPYYTNMRYEQYYPVI
ncbi:hypothetical protein [Bacillus sp. V2I10]|uniref:hypothetical protein n=1 Tax=Bacillus sp. V2I10 TaxID=3042276 RepID=UPI002784A112|nr:hypothetical protein [Bacillus sp. V2I10]MDQ0859091.1 hypothetical protein [Bacillus sp. V2I10]